MTKRKATKASAETSKLIVSRGARRRGVSRNAVTGRYALQQAGAPRKLAYKRLGGPSAKAVTNDEVGLNQVEPGTHPARSAEHFRRIIAARKQLEAAEQKLRNAVEAAREAGDSWTAIGAALDVSKQAAYQRFGRVKV